MKKLVLFVMAVCLVLSGALMAQKITLKKFNFNPGEEIKVTFETPAGYATNAWIGIIPSHVAHGSEAENDKHDLDYQYLSGKTSGTLAYKAPAKPGKYDFRMNDTDNNGKEVTHISFTVVEGLLKLNKFTFKPGEDIKLHFKTKEGFATNAWIGIVPSHVAHGSEAENDKHDMSYQYLGDKKAGTLTYKAPAKPGKYDFRLHDTDNNGKEVEHITFEVK